MKTISQVAKLTGISVRTLQYYDEIGLLKPTALTESGYRLYSDAALEQLQQILFFKELDFSLKDILNILQKPDYEKAEIYRSQKALLSLKRNRLSKLIRLLERLEKGEHCMSFQEFDLSEYIAALELFKAEKKEDVIRYWGSMERFEQLIRSVKEHESDAARIAVRQYGSIERYTEAMKYNLEHFSELMKKSETLRENAEEILQKSEMLFFRLTADQTQDVSSPRIQSVLQEIMDFSQETNIGIDMGDGYWDMVAEAYSQDPARAVIDQKYGTGASDYIARALRYYLDAR